MANVKDIPEIEAKLNAAKGVDPNFEAIYTENIGPNNGLQYDEDTGKVTIAKEQWAVIKATGEIVRRSEYIGPAHPEWKLEGEDYIVPRA